MKLNIAAKYSLILILPMLAAMTVLWEFYSFMEDEQDAVPYMNVAGRQRMLSEQLHNYAHMVHLGQDDDRRPLKEMISHFSESLDTLQFGGKINELDVDLKRAPADVLPSLEALRQTWEPIRHNLMLIAELPVSDSRSKMAYARLNSMIPTLTKTANSVVTSFGKHSAALHVNMRNILMANAGFALLLLGLGFLAARRFIVAPVLQLKGVANAIDHGDYSQRVDIRSTDELGKLAEIVNRMAASIEASFQMERTLRQRQEELTRVVIDLGSSPIEEAMIKQIGETARNITGSRYAIIAYDAEGDNHYTFGLSSEQESALTGFNPRHSTFLQKLWEEQQVVNISGLDQRSPASNFPEGHPPIADFLGVPILFGNEVFGAICLADREDGHPFSSEDEDIVGMLATACAIAISNSNNIHKLERAKAELEERVADRTLDLELANQRLRSREIELELANDELANANEAKNQFLANTSHELRTPLNAIIGFSDLLNNKKIGPLTEKQQRYVHHVHSSGKRLLTIINDLLDISKIEAGMMDIEETVCVPLSTAQQVISELMPLARAKQIKLTLHEGEKAGMAVLVDAGKFHQMLVNLTGNAIKFTPERGDVDLSVRVECSSEKEHRIVAQVQDTGIGIPEQDQRRIFEPFVQLRGGLDRKEGGTGLGLSLTRKQVNMLGGDLTLESKEGAGSKFTIDLPVQPCDGKVPPEAKIIQSMESEPASTPPSSDEFRQPPRRLRPRILIIDENEARSAEAIRTLVEEGYEVDHAELENALTIVQENSPFLLVLGIPANKGELHQHLQLFKEHELTRHVPIILMGGNAQTLEFSMGTVDVVDKCIEQQDLLDVIARHSKVRPAAIRVPSVLVIDDDPSVRELLRETLVNAGYHALLASNGEEGIRLAIECEPDVIILDLMMPDITGFDVMSRLRQHPTATDIPIIVYTAKDLTRAEALVLGRDAERVLLKGSANRSEILRQLQKLELMYPVRAHLIDANLDCFNLRYLYLRLEQEIAAAKRHGQRFSLVGWEMDGYNDYIMAHGERWGTAALKEVVVMVKDATRLDDICVHIDTARFVLFLPNITPEGALRVANKLCIHIRRHRFPLPGEEHGKLTGSFGVAHFGFDGEEMQPLLQSLSKRIGESMRAGGDQCLAELPASEFA